MSIINTNQTFYTDKAVASRYDIGRSTVWDWLKKKKLPHPIKINGRTRWRLSDLQAWENENFRGVK